MRLHSFALLALFVAVAGCEPDPIVASGTDAAADVSSDVTALDVTPLDVAPDDRPAVSDAADVSSDGSVDAGCGTAPDTCPAGDYCDPATRSCQRGCRDDESCRGEGGDGGAALARCNTVTRACVECTTDTHCGAGRACVGNACVAACAGGQCPNGQTCCAGACVDTRANSAHCGACGTACAAPNAEPACAEGRCAVGACTGAFRDCDSEAGNGCEVDTRSNLAHCGGCGRVCPAAPNAAPTCADGACGIVCSPGFGDCDGDAANGCEVDLRATAAHCGACGSACAMGNGATQCVDGACVVTSCSAGFGDCDGNAANGCEVDLRTAAAHCGTCGRMCPRLPRAEGACVMGSCGLGACDTGYGDCDRDPVTGCEADLFSDGSHCGRCGNTCSTEGAFATCTSGRCALSGCRAGFGDCDGDTANGCETDTRTSLAHCGACARPCAPANAAAACVESRCVVASCNAGYGDCDNNAANGCEVDTRSSLAHCGACGRACAPANAVAACRSGVCAIGSCNAGFADCDGDPSNGCEVDTRSSLSNCGACGRGCAPANAAAACRSGVCAIGSCNAGFADCDNSAANGCEANLGTSTTHCGRCGNACPVPMTGSAVCRAGTCGVGSCPAGRADCDGNVANGCEATPATDVNHCGGCGVRCAAPANATAACANGACGIGSCNAGFADCDGNPANGCEVDTRSSLSNCGACGRACAAANGTPACSAGACTVSACNAGFANCNGLAGDGCEVDTRTSLAHCGACGAACVAPTGGTATCGGGTCTRACPAGQSNCGGVCRATGAACTSAGTGGCAQMGTVVCAMTGTTTTCSATPRTSGACTSPTGGTCNGSGTCACADTQAVCGGTCRNVATDVSNCGGCGRACAAPTGGTVTCVAGACVQACPAGQSNCNGVCRATGAACTSAGTGGCAQMGTVVCAATGTGTACSATPRTSGACTSPANGTCNASGTCACAAGLTSCSNTCRDLRTDNANCGACNNACAAGRLCTNGVCIVQGVLRFTLTWDRNGDEDILVRTPNGCTLRSRARTGCGGVFERDDTGGTGPENVYWSSNPPAGVYTVCAVPWAISGATNWRVQVVRNGAVAQTWTGAHASSSQMSACPAGMYTVGTYTY